MKVFKLIRTRGGEESVKFYNDAFSMLSDLLQLLEWCPNDTFIVQLTGKEKDDE